jgi:hypothetical protein
VDELFSKIGLAIMRGASILLLVLAFCASPVNGQVVARQGEQPVSELQEFDSPMILELPLKNFEQQPYGTGRDFNVRRFYCDDVSISTLVVHKNRGPKKRRATVFEVKGSLSVRPSHDRLAALRFDLINGEAHFGTWKLDRINAEEGKVKKFNISLLLEEGDYSRLFTPSELARLRITMTVVDND